MSANRTPGDDWWFPEDVTAASGNERLDAVLRAAAAPAHPGELAGEEAAVAAFRAAAAVETAPSRPSVIRTVLAKVLTVKAVIVLAVGGSAGIVLAASGGVLPAPWSATPQAPPAPVPLTTTTPAPSAEPEHRTTLPGPSTQEPSVAELCAVYEAGRGKGKQLADPEFGPLVTAAGGEDKVGKYCAAHRTKPSKDERPQPSKDGKPADKPGATGPEPPKSTKPGKADPDRTGTPGRPTGHPPAPGGPATGKPHGAGPPTRGG